MKTPRELLLTRHQKAEPQLNAVRERALDAFSPGPREVEPRTNSFQTACRDFFRIPRVAWAVLAAAWLLIIGLNAASLDRQPVRQFSSSKAQSSPAELQQALREQKRIFAELVGSPEWPDAVPPRFVPRPRSDRQLPLAFA